MPTQDTTGPAQDTTGPAQDISGTTALVTGASRGFGRAIAVSLSKAGAHVVGVARSKPALDTLHAQLGDTFTPVVGDAADPVLAGQLVDAYRPRTLVLVAGATPLARPIQQQTWQSFSRNWDVDVQHVFHWTREALLAPLGTGSVVIAFSSGAALRGSPLSGGYAGAKAAIRFLTEYADQESKRGALGIRFVSVLPQITQATGLGAPFVAAYAARQGITVAEYIEALGGSQLTPEQVGMAIADLATDPGSHGQEAYLLTSAGLTAAGQG